MLDLSKISAAFNSAPARSTALAESQALPAGSLPADQALDKITELYRSLQAQAQRIQDLYGNKIPCSVQSHHNAAAGDYYRAAQNVFAQLESANPQLQILQQFYDGQGNIVGEKLGGRPIMPTTFASANCPNTQPTFNGLGLAPLAPLVVKVVIWLIVAGAVVAAVNQIVTHWPGTDVDAAEGHKIWVNTRLDCVKRYRDEQGLSLEAAEKKCAEVAGEKAPRGSGMSISTVALILGGTAIVGFFLYKIFKKPEKDDGESVELDGACCSKPRLKKCRC